ncbi:MAG: hypothetical protein KA715_07260 [Xanthomonadaceae bacterium]|nr:hypothetical protein [Xanthomonadaceae bacterium]
MKKVICFLALSVLTVFLSTEPSRATAQYKECKGYEYAYYESMSGKPITLKEKNPAKNKFDILPATIQVYQQICKFFTSETNKIPKFESKDLAHFENIWCDGKHKGQNDCYRHRIIHTDKQKNELSELLNNQIYKGKHGGGVLKTDNTTTLGTQWDRYKEEARKNHIAHTDV